MASPLGAEDWPGELIKQARQAVLADQRVLANVALCLECGHAKVRHGDEGCLIYIDGARKRQYPCGCTQRYA